MMQFQGERRLNDQLMRGVGDDTRSFIRSGDDTVSGGNVRRTDVYAFQDGGNDIIDATCSECRFLATMNVESISTAVVTVTTAGIVTTYSGGLHLGIDIETIGAYGLAGDDTITVHLRHQAVTRVLYRRGGATATASTHRCSVTAKS